jgi:subtilase family serine protease
MNLIGNLIGFLARSFVIGIAGRKPLIAAAALTICAAVTPAAAQSDRPPASPQAPSTGTQQLQGHIRPEFAQAPLVGQLAGATPLHIAISLPLRNSAQLDQLLQQISDPASPQYRHFLSEEQFDQQFGPTEQDYSSVVAFARANRLDVTDMDAGHLVLGLSGTASSIQTALHITLAARRRSDGTTFHAPDREPSLNLATPILHISGLDDFSPPRHGQTGSGFSGTFTGSDLRNAYAPGVPQTGQGQSVGILELQNCGFFTADPAAYEAAFGLTVPIQVVTVDGANGTPCGGQDAEVAGDIQMALAMAPKLNSVVVYEGQNLDNILAAAASSNPLPSQLSLSWTLPTDSGASVVVNKLASRGVTIFVISGDKEAMPCPLAPPPTNLIVADTRALPNVTVVGGSLLVMSGNAWASETAAVAGGGIMTGVMIPSYQMGLATAANQGSGTNRMIPDVAMSYFDNFDFNTYINSAGQQLFTQKGGFGGTSASAPLWAGYMALVNQAAQENKSTPAGSGLGFINPTLYAVLADPAAYALAFHDIQQGTNVTPGCGGYNATPGYDLVTGLGSPTAKLIDLLAPKHPKCPPEEVCNTCPQCENGCGPANENGRIVWACFAHKLGPH